jgi:hypothetical protein
MTLAEQYIDIIVVSSFLQDAAEMVVLWRVGNRVGEHSTVNQEFVEHFLVVLLLDQLLREFLLVVSEKSVKFDTPALFHYKYILIVLSMPQNQSIATKLKG